jgi:hypothetical protein
MPTLTLRSAARALLVGSFLGAALVQFASFLPVIVFARDEFLQQWSASDAHLMALVFVVTWAVFAVGLSVVGIPLWWMCHRLGWRSARAALALGFLATFSVSLILTLGPLLASQGGGGFYADRVGLIVAEDQMMSYGLYRALWQSFEFALLGAVVGGVIWRLAYSGPFVRWDIIPGRE